MTSKHCTFLRVIGLLFLAIVVIVSVFINVTYKESNELESKRNLLTSNKKLPRKGTAKYYKRIKKAFKPRKRNRYGCGEFRGYNSIPSDKKIASALVKRINLTKGAQENGAVCLDGSVPIFYYRKGRGSGKNKWVIYFNGGGWCAGIDEIQGLCVDDCSERITFDPEFGESFGSSKYYPPYLEVDRGILSLNSTINPTTYNWNVAILAYCEGSSYSSDLEEVKNSKNGKLYFRGNRILKSFFETLTTKQYGLKKSPNVIIGGCSAGALATFMHIDRIKEKYLSGNVNLMALPDSGWFPEYEGPETKYITAMKWIFDNTGVSKNTINEDCIKYYKKRGSTGYECMFSQNLSPFVKQKIFYLQSRFDGFKIGCIWGGNAENNTAVNIWGQNLTKFFVQKYVKADGNKKLAKKRATYLDSCDRHCDDGNYPGISINGWTEGQAIDRFYKGTTLRKFWYQKADWPCIECCPPEPEEEEEEP